MKLFSVLLVVLLPAILFAAPPDYIVYYAKGTIIKTGNKTNSRLAKGDVLYNSDVIDIADRSEVVLVCRNYNTIQLNKKGRTSLKDLQMCSAAPSSLTSSYFHYVWEELLSHHSTPDQDPRHYMRNKGAVSRGCTMVQTSLYVDTIYYAAGSLPLYWKSALPAAYISFFPDEHDNLVTYKAPLTPGQPVRIENLYAAAKEEGDHYWQITDEQGSSCGRNVLTVLPASEYARRVNDLLSGVIITTPAETALMKGYVLEENHFLAEAFNYYKTASKLDPKNLFIRKAYSRYYEIK